MKREKLTALIDRVIGKSGVLRTPSWWVRNILNNMLDYTDEAVKNLKVDEEMSNTSENAVSNKVIKEYVDGLVGDIGSILDTINGEKK